MAEIITKKIKRGNYRERKPVVPEEIRRAFLDHVKHNADLEIALVFAIWQTMIRQLLGVTLGRQEFDEAFLSWELAPRLCPLMTMAIDTEDHLALMIRTMKPMPLRGDRCYEADDAPVDGEETRQAA